MLSYIKQQNSACKVILCNLCPRTDVDDFELCELNGIIMSLAKEYGHTGADIYSAFHEKDGNICERFYQNGWIHVNSSGMTRFMRVLHDIEHMVEDFDQCCYPKKPMIRSNIPRYSYSQMRGLTQDGGNHSVEDNLSKMTMLLQNVKRVGKIITIQGLVAIRNS